MKRTKQEMITRIKNQFSDWMDMYTYFNNYVNGSSDGWYMAYDGPTVEEMYLTNKHPMSDESGEVITINDFEQYKG